MEEDLELDQEKKILYDLFIPCEWPETTTILVRIVTIASL